MHTIRKPMPILKTLILGSVIFLPMGMMQAANAQHITYLANASQSCIGGRNGTCIPDKGPGGKKVPPTIKVNRENSHKKGKGNPCKPSGTTKGCRDWINDGYKPKPRPKK